MSAPTIHELIATARTRVMQDIGAAFFEHWVLSTGVGADSINNMRRADRAIGRAEDLCRTLQCIPLDWPQSLPEPDFVGAMQEVRSWLTSHGIAIDTIAWLTSIYEGRGYPPEEARQMARGEDPP